MSETPNVQAVKEYHYFAGLDEQEVFRATRHLRLQRIAAGDTLFRQGESGAWFYLLVRGELELRVRVPARNWTEARSGESDDQDLCTLYPPAIVGEMSLLLDEPRTATAVAKTDCELWQVGREEFRLATLAGDEWANHLLLVISKVLASRLSETNRKLASLIALSQKNEPDIPVKRDDLEILRERLFSQWNIWKG